MVDAGASVNILPLSVIYELGYDEGDLYLDSTPVANFADNKTKTLGKISLYIVVWSLKMCHTFHVMKIEPIFHVLFGKPWIDVHRCVPSYWH